MNYREIYINLILSRQILKRNKEIEYYEVHHVYPKCFGGSNDPSNLVFLTPKEHIIAHKLLIHCYEGWHKGKMICALWRMCSVIGVKKNRVINARQYKYAKEKVSEFMKIYRNKPVSQFALKGELICDFSSIKNAMKETGVLSITGFLRCNINQSGGFLWKYKNEQHRTEKQEKHFNNIVKNGVPARKEYTSDFGRKISEGKKGKFIEQPKKRVKVAQFTKSGKFIKIFSSLMEAKGYIGVALDSLDFRHKTSGGFVWIRIPKRWEEFDCNEENLQLLFENKL